MLRIDFLTPPYPVAPTIALGEFERRIMGEPYEVAGVFGTDGRLILAPKQGALDAVEFLEEEIPYLENATVSHNHPSGTTFSYDDMILAGEGNLASLRAVRPDGTVLALLRPPEGWPSTDLLLRVVERSIVGFRQENERLRREGTSIIRGRDRDHFMILEQQSGCAEIGVEMRRSDVWRR